MKVKVLVFLLCFSLVFSASTGNSVLAAGYSYYLDENCSMEDAYWIIEYTRLHDMPWYELIGKSMLYGLSVLTLNPKENLLPKDKSWMIHKCTYEFDFVNLHENEMIIGYLPEYYTVWFEFEFSSYADDRAVKTSRYIKSYKFGDYYDPATEKFSIDFDYDDLLLLSGFPAANHTVLSGVTVWVAHNSFHTFGTEERFAFTYRDNDFKDSVVDVFAYSRYNPSDGVMYETTETILVDDDTGIMRLSNFQPNSDSYEDGVLDLSSFYSFIVDSVSIIWDVINFLFNFMSMLPQYISLLIPFIPSQLIYGFYYALLFGLILAIARLVVSVFGKIF